MDDAAILREIARRIREGMDAPGKPAAASDAPRYMPEIRDNDADTIARLAHELRTPLGAIVAAAEIMAGQLLGPLENRQYLEYAENIATSGRHALNVVDRVLHDWKSTEPHGLEFTQFDLNRLVERTVAVLQPIARARSQTVETDLEHGLPHIIADTTSVRQILLNLLTNAVKYTTEGSRIHIATLSVLDGPVTLRVTDDGPGMSKALRSAVMEGQSQAVAEGTGFGLPLVKQLAAANGATIELADAPGRGTTVSLTFAKDKVVPV